MNFKYGDFFRFVEENKASNANAVVPVDKIQDFVTDYLTKNNYTPQSGFSSDAQENAKAYEYAVNTITKALSGAGTTYGNINMNIGNAFKNFFNDITSKLENGEFKEKPQEQEVPVEQGTVSKENAPNGTEQSGQEADKPQNQEQSQETPTQNPSDLLTIAKQGVSDIAKNLSTNEISIKVESKSVGSKLKAIKEAKGNITSIGNFNVVITMSSQDTNGTENNQSNEPVAEGKENQGDSNAIEAEKESLAKQFLKGKINESENNDVSKSVSNIVKQIISSFGTREIGNETVQITNSGNATTSENNGVLTITVPMAIVRVDTKEKSTLGDKVQKVQNFRNQNADIALKKAQAKAMKTDAKARLAAARKGKGSGGNILKNFSPYGNTSSTTGQSYTKSVL